MKTAQKCRAKNPSTCRVHGSGALNIHSWFHNQDIEPRIVFTQVSVGKHQADPMPLGVERTKNSYIFYFAKDAKDENCTPYELDALYEIDGTTLPEIQSHLNIELSWLKETIQDQSMPDKHRQVHVANYVRLNNLRKHLEEKQSLNELKNKSIAYQNVVSYAEKSEKLNLPWSLGSGSIQKIHKYGTAVRADYHQLPEHEQAIILTQSLVKHEPALLNKDVNWNNPEYPSYTEDLWNIYKRTENELAGR